MRYLMIALGTFGDLAPMLELGSELKRRGHEVVIASPESFRQLVELRGLGFCSVLSGSAHQAWLNHPDLWHPRRFFSTLVQGLILPSLSACLELIQALAASGELRVVAAYCGSLAARLGCELTGARHLSLWTDAAAIRSLIAPPVLSGLEFFPRLPLWLRRPLRWGLDLWSDRMLAPAVNALRPGRPAVGRVLDWMVSPVQSVCLFPDWYAPPQLDWPPGCAQAGFVLTPARPLSADLERFLAEGSAPVLATFGTGMARPERLLAEAAEGAHQLGLRSVLVAPRQAQVPARLPAGCLLSQDHPSFSSLLPRTCAFIHHGGSGNSAQALAAGIPQLVVAMAHDQPDNASRLESLGVAVRVGPTRFASADVRRGLEHLMQPKLKLRCRELAARIDSEIALQRACQLLEG